jgi:hypothetical protein
MSREAGSWYWVSLEAKNCQLRLSFLTNETMGFNLEVAGLSLEGYGLQRLVKNS